MACASIAGSVHAAVLPKRGLCANKLSPVDIKALEPGVGWWYSWFYQIDDIVRGSTMQFIPMIWTAGQDRIDGAVNFRHGNRAPMLFAINEPNLTGQANMEPKAAAESWENFPGYPNPVACR